MLEIGLTAKEAGEVRGLARSLAARYDSTDDPALLGDVGPAARQVPRRLREEIAAYMDRPTSDLALIGNHLVGDAELGTTPVQWKSPESSAASLEYEMIAMLYGSVLGSVFGWATQQQGHIVNDIVPMQSMADQQVGASSSIELAWHTEDAFHPGRADFICLFCLRNPTGAPTTVATLTDVQKANGGLPAALFTPCVHIPADDAQQAGADEMGVDEWTGPALGAVPILVETETGCEMRVDPAYMFVAGDDEDVYDAVTAFCRAIDDQITDVVLRPGDMLILDNRRAVHGRRPFKPTYSGRDRWLKRVNVAMSFEAREPYCVDRERRLLA
jgi:Fe(II)/alpha-ketoglutarate-dependent arginine beta-hydroxylase